MNVCNCGHFFSYFTNIYVLSIHCLTLGIAGGTVTTFLPLVVFAVMTLVMCPSIIAGSNFKKENDVYAENLERMFHLDDKSIAPVKKKNVRETYDDPEEKVIEKSNFSIKSYHSYDSNQSKDDVE